MKNSVDLVILLIEFSIPVILLLLGLIVGRSRERNHLRDLADRERQFSDMMVTSLRDFPGGTVADSPSRLVLGEAVIATDYLKTFLANLKNLLGGEVRSYQVLLFRARKEALLRMLQDARDIGCNAVCNIRYEASDIGANSKSAQGVVMACSLVSGTAYVSATKGKGPAPLLTTELVDDAIA